ncbi:MAG: hypothetical protein AAGE88_18310 [Actinomycetota bacterium]
MTTAPMPNVGGQPDDDPDHTPVERQAATTLDRVTDEVRQTSDRLADELVAAGGDDLAAAASYIRSPAAAEQRQRLLGQARETTARAEAALERARATTPVEGPPPHPAVRGRRRIVLDVPEDVQDAICTERFGTSGTDLITTEAELDQVLTDYAIAAVWERTRNIDTGPWRDRLDQLLGEVR